jgi:signal peptidase I
MEPTLHCAKGAGTPGCLGKFADRVVVQPGATIKRGGIVVFRTPTEAALKCGEGGLFVKRVIGLSGETLREDDHGFLWVRDPGPADMWAKLSEPYLSASRRLADSAHFGQKWHVPKSEYFMVGDNRSESCDSRTFGSVPARNIIGPVVRIIRPQ